MAFGQPSNPDRFGSGQTNDPRSLYLEVFGGEVIAAFHRATVTDGRHRTKTVGPGQKAWRFPKVWLAQAEYHTPGQELLGLDIPTTETLITIDDILTSHTGISDLDSMLTHFDVRGQFSTEMGRALARHFDKNVFRQIVKTAREPGDGPFPGGDIIADSSLVATDGVVDGEAWIEAIRKAGRDLFDKDVPEDTEKFLSVDAATFDAIRFATNTQGNYIVMDRDYGNQPAGGIQSGAPESFMVAGVTVLRSRNMPNTDETTGAATEKGNKAYVYPKYRADYSNTLGVLWIPDAVATVKMMDIGMETTRDTRRLEDFMVAKALVGHGTHRPEGAIEFAAPAA